LGANQDFFEKLSTDAALQLCDEINKESIEASSKRQKHIINLEDAISKLETSVPSHKIKDRLWKIIRLRFQNTLHERDFEQWYTQQQLNSYAMIALYVIFFSCWHAFWDIYTFCDEKLKFKSPSLCLDTSTGWTILVFRIAYFAGIPLVGLCFGMLKGVSAKVTEIFSITLIGLYVYGHIYWSSYLNTGNVPDNTKVRAFH
jgi:hypothetical protein